MSEHKKCAAAAIVAAVLSFSAVFGICRFARPPEKIASATVFVLGDGDALTPRTDISRQISALRRYFTDEDFLKAAAAQSGISVDPDKLKSAVSVSRMGDSCGAEIALSGMENAADAPILLMNMVNYAENDVNAPEFYTISCCDMENPPEYPDVQLSAFASGAVGGACYLFARRKRRRRHGTETSRKSRDSAAADNFSREMSYLEGLRNFGSAEKNASKGMDKSGHIAIAEKVLSAMNGGKILAVALGDRNTSAASEEAAKFASYLAAAAAKGGRRVLMIECDLSRPLLGSIFNVKSRGGLSDIAAGSCKLWDAAYINARQGIDLISENKSYPCPAAVFGTAAVKQVIDYLSAQYDLVIMLAPPAWTREECELIFRESDGVLLCLTDGRLSEAALNGIDSTAAKVLGYAVIEEKTEKTEAEEKASTPKKTGKK